jgi:DNA-binding IclR family transcriptional regulator
VSRPKLDADEIGKRLSLPKSSVYRYLNTLLESSVLQYDAVAKKYTLGVKIFAMGAAAHSQLELRKISRPILDKLASKTKETVTLIGLEKDRAICIDRTESNFAVRFSISIGESFPLYASATGRVVMAYLSPEVQDRIIAKGLKKFTPRTVTSPVELKKELCEIARSGFAHSDEELDPGARAVAAPIFNTFGEIVAGLSIAGPVQRFTEEKIQEYKGLVIESAKKISVRLGGITNHTTP